MAKEIKKIQCETDREVIDVIDTIAARCSHFKVGKTGESIQDRGNQPDYQDYDYIQSLFSNSSKSLVSELESLFINKFKKYRNNDNDKDGAQSINDQMKDSGEYHLYVVWKE